MLNFKSSFEKFDNRLNSIEQMIDEIKLDDQVDENLQNNLEQQKQIEKEFLKQIDASKNLKKNMEFIQNNLYGEVDKYRQLIQKQK